MEQPQARAARHADQAVWLNEKDLETVMQWWSLCEKYEEQSGLAKRLQSDHDLEPLRILVDTFCNRGKCRKDSINILSQYVWWQEGTRKEIRGFYVKSKFLLR